MDLCFIETNNRRQIKSLYAPYQFSVNVDTYNVKTVQKYLISVETLDQLLVNNFKILFFKRIYLIFIIFSKSDLQTLQITAEFSSAQLIV